MEAELLKMTKRCLNRLELPSGKRLQFAIEAMAI